MNRLIEAANLQVVQSRSSTTARVHRFKDYLASPGRVSVKTRPGESAQNLSENNHYFHRFCVL